MRHLASLWVKGLGSLGLGVGVVARASAGVAMQPRSAGGAAVHAVAGVIQAVASLQKGTRTLSCGCQACRVHHRSWYRGCQVLCRRHRIVYCSKCKTAVQVHGSLWLSVCCMQATKQQILERAHRWGRWCRCGHLQAHEGQDEEVQRIGSKADMLGREHAPDPPARLQISPAGHAQHSWTPG